MFDCEEADTIKPPQVSLIYGTNLLNYGHDGQASS